MTTPAELRALTQTLAARGVHVQLPIQLQSGKLYRVVTPHGNGVWYKGDHTEIREGFASGSSRGMLIDAAPKPSMVLLCHGQYDYAQKQTAYQFTGSEGCYTLLAGPVTAVNNQGHEPEPFLFLPAEDLRGMSKEDLNTYSVYAFYVTVLLEDSINAFLATNPVTADNLDDVTKGIKDAAHAVLSNFKHRGTIHEFTVEEVTVPLSPHASFREVKFRIQRTPSIEYIETSIGFTAQQNNKTPSQPATTVPLP